MTAHRNGVHRIDAPMADGRTLRYYDEGGAGRVPPRDVRDLPVVEHGSVMRFDVLTGEWVTIAAHRMDRTFMPPADLDRSVPALA